MLGVGLRHAPNLARVAQARQQPRHRPQQLIVHGEGAQRVSIEFRRAEREVAVAAEVQPERREADALVAQRGEDIAAIGGRIAGLGHIGRIVRAMVKVEHLLVVARLRLVDVGPDQVDRRRRRLPHVEHVMGRTAAGEGQRVLRAERVAQRRIGVHRQRVLGLAGFSHLVDEAGGVPGLEHLVGVAAEGLAPGSADVAGAGEFGRNLPREQRLGRRRVVAHGAVDAGLVLDLHQDHGVARAVDLAQVAHQLGEGGAVGLQRLGEHRRQRAALLALLGHHPREALVVELHPVGRIARAVVLPGPEPQQRQPHVMLARLGDQGVEEAEVEMAFGRLDLAPGDGDQHRIGVDLLDRRPDLGQHGRPGAGIVHLGAQHQIGRAVHHQGVAAVGVRQPRRGRRRRRHSGDQADRGQKGSKRAHQRDVLASARSMARCAMGVMMA